MSEQVANSQKFVIDGQKFIVIKDAFKKLAEERESAGLLGWNLTLEDTTGRKREAFIRGPVTADEVVESAAITFRNWKLIEFERATTSRPPATAKPVPKSAYSHGVLESLSKRRRY